MRACIVLLALGMLLPVEARTCSTVVATGGGSVLVANNRDLLPVDHAAALHVVPRTSQGYGTLYWGVKNSWMQCGVNEAGLFVDRVAVPVVDDYAYMGDEPGLPVGLLLLEQCATVEEAVALFRRYRVTALRSVHYMIADRTGAAAVVEWDGDAIRVIRKEGPLQMMTNFRLSDPAAGAHPCYRYNAMRRMLRGKRHTAELLRRTLDATHLEDRTYYSNIIDLTEGTMTVYGCHDFGCPRVLDIRKELDAGPRRYLMEDLFPLQRVPMEELERRNGLVYRIAEDAPFSGTCYLLHENGQLLKEGRVKNGRCAGCWKYFDPHGAVTREDHYKRVLLYYESGTLRAEGMLRNRLMVGPWRWLNEDGTVALEGDAMDGIFYRHGERHPFSGTMTASYRNGDPCSRRRFARGMLEGEAIDWYVNGHLRCEGQYEEGRYAGQWIFYHRDGSLDHVMLYEDGGSSP
jgi:antitoxin component YwqK of YwqJK toxin-antitoxin module